MRIFLGIVGLLMVLLAVLGGLLGAAITGDVDTDGSWSCTSYADAGAGSSSQDCKYDSFASPPDYDRQRDLGMEAVLGSVALFIGGCALIGGAVAGSGRKQQQPVFAPQPAAAGGPPSYGGYPSERSGGDGDPSRR